MLSLEEILREGVIPPVQQGGGELQEAAKTGDTQVREGALSNWNLKKKLDGCDILEHAITTMWYYGKFIYYWSSMLLLHG